MKNLKYYFNKLFKSQKQSNQPRQSNFMDSIAIYKFDRNKLFKGHQGRISMLNHDDDQILDFSNTYFGGYTSQKYWINKNKTYSCYVKQIKLTNKLQNKLESLSEHMHEEIIGIGNIPGIRFKYKHADDKNDINTSMNFEIKHAPLNDLQVNIEYKEVKPGLHLHNHFASIEMLNRLNHRYKVFKHNLEKLSIEELSKKLLENRINAGKVEDSINMYRYAPDQHEIYHNQFKNLNLELDDRFFE